MGIFGAPDIEKLKTKKDIAGLIAALNYRANDYKYRPLRKAAIEALGQLKDLRAVEPLIAFVLDANREEMLRSEAVSVLGKIGDIRAVDPLIAIVKQGYWGDYHMAGQAANALGRIGDGKAVDSLIGLLNGKNEYDSRCAAQALGEIGDKRAIAPLVASILDRTGNVDTFAKVLDSLYKDASVDELIGLLKKSIDNPYVNLKDLAIRLLGKINDPAALEPIVELLQDSNPNLQLAAVEILGAYKDPRSVDPLIGLLDSPKKDIRYTIVDFLGQMGDPRVVPSILVLLKDEDTYVRACAVRALGKLRDPRAIGPLIDLLFRCSDIIDVTNSSSDYGLVSEICEVLGEMGDRKAIFGIIRYIHQGIPDAAEAAGKLGDLRAVEPLINSLTEFYWRSDYSIFREKAIQALGILGDPRGVDILVQFLEYPLVTHDIDMNPSDNSAIRVYASEALGKIGAIPSKKSLENPL